MKFSQKKVKSEDEVESEERRCNSAKVRRKKIHPRQMLEVAKCCVFPMVRVSGESKSRLVKAAGAEVAVERRHEKLHAAVARSTFPSQNVKKLTVSEHCLKLRC